MTMATTVLVVEDEAHIRELVCLHMQIEGYICIPAGDGRQALAKVRGEEIDLVLTDLVMPEQEGFETIQVIRREWPSIKVIAMSGAFGGEFLRIAKLLGAHSTLQKPLRAEVVLRAVADALDA